MDFLENSVLPQSAHHMVLLKYLLVLTYIILIPYLSVLFGSLSLSLYFKRKSAKTSEAKFLKFAKDLIDLITFNKGVAFALGIVPMLSAAFCYAQLLHLSNNGVGGFILLALVFFIVALVLIYIYKYAFHLKSIFELASKSENAQEELKDDINSYTKIAAGLFSKSGLYGWIFLLVSTYIFSAAVQLAADTSKWGSVTNVFELLISMSAFTYYLQFVVASFAVTSAVMLYKFFRPNSETNIKNEEYSAFVKSFALKTGLITTILWPLLIVINVIAKPAITYSYDLFGATLLALLLILLIANLFYSMIKESNVKFGSAVIYLFVTVIFLLVLKEQFGFDTSTKKQYAVISANYEQYQKEMNEKLGIAVVEVSGADIFNGKCIACHQYDRNLVGPAYNDVLPKYEGKMDELVKFILNPVKVNPEFPPMPNQGLKPNEGEAIAKYLMETYKK